MEAGSAPSEDGPPGSIRDSEQGDNAARWERLAAKPPLHLQWAEGHGPGDKDRVFRGPPSTPHACTHCHGRGAGPAPSPQPHGRRRGGGRGEGTRFWSFNTCRIKFVSVQSAVEKGPSAPRGKFLPAKSRSSPVTSLAAAPGDPRPWRWADGSGLVASWGHVRPVARLGGNQVPSWGCADAGTGQGWPAHIHGVGPRSLLRGGRFPRCPTSASPGTARGQGSPQGLPARRPSSGASCGNSS